MLLKFPMRSLSILITSVLNSESVSLLISILFSSFLVVLFFSFIWAMFLCLLILAAVLCLSLCIKQSCLTPCLSSVAICTKVHQWVGWDGVLGNCLGGATCVNKVDGVSDKVSRLCGSVWGRAQKGDNTSAWPLEFCLGGSCLLALALLPVFSLSSRMPLVPFQLLPLC